MLQTYVSMYHRVDIAMFDTADEKREREKSIDRLVLLLARMRKDEMSPKE